MNRKEINEIKKIYTLNNCSITRIAGCYVDGDKNIRSTFANNFLAMPEEIMHKYFAIFKKALSGTLGKQLMTFQFPTDMEQDGGTQQELLKLRDSKLKNDDMLQAFYEKIIDTYQYVGNYLIILIHNAYDVPGKGTDNLSQEDASDEVYEYITCIICPVELSKPGLSYDQTENNFKNRDCDWVVGSPEVSFMFPAFNDRTSDIHEVLYYEKKPELQHEEVLTEILGCNRAFSAVEQKEGFDALLESCKCSAEEIMNIHGKLNEMVKENKESSAEVLTMEKKNVEKLLQEYVSEDTMYEFSKSYDECIGKKAVLVAENITDTKKLEIKSPDVTIKITPERGDLIKEKVIDGIKCIVIEMNNDIEINGVRAN